MNTFLNHFYLPLLLIVISLFFVQCNGDKTNPIIKQIAIETNKHCPIQVDEFTVLDSCIALPNKTIRNNYTVAITDTSNLNMDIFRFTVRKESINNIRNAKDIGTKNLISLNATITQRYYDNNGNIILEFSITPEEYNQKFDTQSDEYLYNEIKQIVEAYQTQLPIEYGDSVTTTKIEASFPRTVSYTVEKADYEKTNPFDSIEFKNERKGYLIEEARSNIFHDLLNGANITYKYIYKGKNRQYLCTLDISPEDYK